MLGAGTGRRGIGTSEAEKCIDITTMNEKILQTIITKLLLKSLAIREDIREKSVVLLDIFQKWP